MPPMHLFEDQKKGHKAIPDVVTFYECFNKAHVSQTRTANSRDRRRNKLYLDNPSVQNYRSKSETAIIIAGCLNFRCFQFFSPFQFPHFGLLIFVRRFVGFFRRFKTGKHMQHEKHAKSVRRQKKMPPAIIPEKAIILHTLEDAGICIYYIYNI